MNNLQCCFNMFLLYMTSHILYVEVQQKWHSRLQIISVQVQTDTNIE